MRFWGFLAVVVSLFLISSVPSKADGIFSLNTGITIVPNSNGDLVCYDGWATLVQSYTGLRWALINNVYWQGKYYDSARKLIHTTPLYLIKTTTTNFVVDGSGYPFGSYSFTYNGWKKLVDNNPGPRMASSADYRYLVRTTFTCTMNPYLPYNGATASAYKEVGGWQSNIGLPL